MLDNKCVRCGSYIQRCHHPLSHNFSICQVYHAERPEDIYDQSKANMNREYPYYMSICETLFGKGNL